MEEYVAITVLSKPGEPEAEFKSRLSRFWTHILRTRKGDYDRLFAETTAFERSGDRLTRKYLAEGGVAAALEAEMASAGVDHEPIDPDDLYTKYEAVAPEWMQIHH